MRRRQNKGIATTLALCLLAAACGGAPKPADSYAMIESDPRVRRPLGIDEALRVAYVAAGLEAAGYALVWTANGYSEGLAESTRDQTFDRGKALLFLADSEITSTLSYALPANQEIHVAAAWNSWRTKQFQLLARIPNTLSQSFPEPETVRDGAYTVGEYMQVVWTDARAHIIVTYLWNSTEALVQLSKTLCEGSDPSRAGAALVSAIGWEERFMVYLAETSTGRYSGSDTHVVPGWASRQRIEGSLVALGVAAAGLAKSHQLAIAYRRGSSDETALLRCLPTIGARELFSEAASLLLKSITTETTFVDSLTEEIGTALDSIEKSDLARPPEASVSSLEFQLKEVAMGDASIGTEALAKTVSNVVRLGKGQLS